MRSLQQEIDYSNNVVGWADLAQSLVPVLGKGVDKIGQNSAQQHESKLAMLNLASKKYDMAAAPTAAREGDTEKKDDKKKTDNTGTIILIVGVLLLLVFGFVMMNKKKK